MTTDQKLQELKKIILDTEGLAVAFSGGLDSTFLLAVAGEVLGDRTLAVTATSPTYPSREYKEAVDIAASLGIAHETVESNELEIDGFKDNPVNRCYYCKSELFQTVKAIAEKHDIHSVADGTNADDLKDHRPGMQAARECSVLSPLLTTGFTKEEIRSVSRDMNLPTSEKPPFACLASRFPYGSEITAEKLDAVGTIEDRLRDMGFKQIRVRHHGDIARIELGSNEIEQLLNADTRDNIVKLTKDAGFLYVTLDLEGYRTGSMNEGL
jgi:uncharacterized protein